MQQDKKSQVKQQVEEDIRLLKEKTAILFDPEAEEGRIAYEYDRDAYYGDNYSEKNLGYADKRKKPWLGGILRWLAGLFKKSTHIPRTSDEIIRELVHDKLVMNPEIRSEGIVVSVADGFVTLHGSIKNVKEKSLAEESAKHVNGVKSVRNELHLEEPIARPLQRSA